MKNKKIYRLLEWTDPDSSGTTKAGLFEIRVYQPTSPIPFPNFPDGKFVASFHVRKNMRNELGMYPSREKAHDACEDYVREVLGLGPRGDQPYA